MDTKYQPAQHESVIYSFWQENGYLKPKAKKPFTILMPPPNANASLHAGHGMYTIEDIVIRWKRVRGEGSLWIPGTDHAGFETQYVYEKILASQKKSRTDYDRETLYQNIFGYVKQNSGLIFDQFKRLGFLADWDRTVFTLDDHVITRVHQTFKKMIKDDLVYRDNYIVNYCCRCGTTLAELEVKHKQRKDPLYYIKYGPFVLATVRPETKFGDTALAVNPRDKRYKKWVGKEVEALGLLGKFRIKVIADDYVDQKFGTGVVKITPAHDPNDFIIGKKHNLVIKQVIDINGRLNELAGPYVGLKVSVARQQVVDDLDKKGLIEKIDDQYLHNVAVCYKCGRDIEPMIMPNWFIKVDSLKKKAINVIKKNKVSFQPKKYKKQILDWLLVMHDWPISRQIVWGIRIPAWYCVDKKSAKEIWVWWLDRDKKTCNGNLAEILQKGTTLAEIELGLQKISVSAELKDSKIIISDQKPEGDFLPETDTFDTWFSSGQWPLITLQEDEYKERFPTDFMGTLTDILKFWISRMIMFSVYIRNEVPFKHVYLWSMVTDKHGVKMSKSKGNVVNPIDLVDKYGACAFRASLLFGIGEGSKVILAEDKVMAMRNYANKIWNMARFIKLNETSKLKVKSEKLKVIKTTKIISELNAEFKELKNKTIKNLDNYKFSRAFDDLYEFIWHRLADIYIEKLKINIITGDKASINAVKRVYFDCLVLLHPFMPFVTEVIWQEFNGKDKSILEERV